MDQTPQTPSAPPAAPVVAAQGAPQAPSPTPRAPLAEYRAEKAKSLAALTDPAPGQPPSAPPPSRVEPPPPAPESVEAESDDEPDLPEVARAEGVKPPEQTREHRWKDPDTGITLDLRRRDHRRIKRALEQGAAITRERDALLNRVLQPAPREEAPATERRPAPSETAEPTLEQFADQPDPYRAWMDAVINHRVSAALNERLAERTAVERRTQLVSRVEQAQQAYDAELPKARERYADFDDAHQEVIDTLAGIPREARVPIVHRLLTSPIRHDLTHYLGSHPEDLAALVEARTPYEQGLVLGAIETRVRGLVNRQAQRPATPPTPAPAPIAPVGGPAFVAAMPDAKRMNLQQWRANKRKLGLTA